MFYMIYISKLDKQQEDWLFMFSYHMLVTWSDSDISGLQVIKKLFLLLLLFLHSLLFFKATLCNFSPKITAYKNLLMVLCLVIG